jgi:hypothetical protein
MPVPYSEAQGANSRWNAAPQLTLGLLLWLPFTAALTGCRVAPPKPEEWLAVGYRSPEQTFATFCTAVAADQADLEYRCLGAYFKQSNGLNQLGYRSFREELLDRWPWIRELANADVERSEAVEDGVWRIQARVKFLWKVQRFEVLLQREDFYELYAGDSLVLDGATDFPAAVRAEAGQAGIEVGVPTQVPIPAAEAGQPLTEVRVGREWKIAAFQTLEAS